jgi:hypothetical protein
MEEPKSLSEIEEKYKESMSLGSDCASRFLSVSNQLHVWHWQVKNYSAHKALGKLYEIITEFADSFVETAMRDGPVVKCIQLDKPVDFEGMEYVNDYLTAQINYAMEKKLMLSERPDLQNMIDEYIATLNGYKYKFTLK